MKVSLKGRLAFFTLLSGIVTGALMAPTSSLAADAPATPAAKLQAARSEIAMTRSNIVLTLEQLDLVRHSDDPHAQFQRFVDQLAAMKERAKLTQERAQLMRTKGDAYFAEWETKAEAVADPAAREAAEAARAKNKIIYDQIVQQMQLTRTNFPPMLAELEQIKTLLAGERSKEKVAEAKDLFMQANWHCVSVQRALMNVEHDLDSLAAGLPGKSAGTAEEKK